jgi:Tfp pilus assembly protein PilN
MRFTINLALKPYYDQRLIRFTLLAVMGLLVLLLGIGLARVTLVAGEIGRIRDDLARFDAKIALRPPDVSEKDLQAQQQKIGAINLILEKRPTRWLKLLDAIERSIPDGVAIAKLDQDPKGDLLKIEGRTRSMQSIQQFLQNLEREQFKEPLLLSHGDLLFGERGKGIQFVISTKVNIR